MNRIVLQVVCVVLCGALTVRAQPKPVETSTAATTVLEAPQEPTKNGAQPPTPEQISKWLSELKTQEDPHLLAMRLSELGKSHQAVRKALFALVSDPKVSPILFNAVVNWIVGENDRSADALAALVAPLAAKDALQQSEHCAVVRAGLERMDRREPLLPVLLERIGAPADSATPLWIAAAVALARDEPAERCDLTSALITVLERGYQNGIDASVRQALYDVTLQQLGAAQAWRTWHDGFVKQHKRDGFTYRALHEEILSAAAGRGIKRDIAAIAEWVKKSQFPPDLYLQSTAAAVRQQAYDGLFKAAGTDPAKRKVAAAKLLIALTDENVSARRRAIEHLGTIADSFRQNSVDLRGQIAEGMKIRLDDDDKATVALAIRAIGKCRMPGKKYGEKLAEVRNKHTDAAPEDTRIRREVVQALGELKEADGIVTLSLNDKDPAIRILAAEVLSRWGDRKLYQIHSVALAKAWTAQDAASRRAFILAIEVLAHFKEPSVTDVLKTAATEGKADQFPAVTSLLAALRAKDDSAPTPQVATELRVFLSTFIPSKLSKPDRERLEGRLGELGGEIAALAVGWASAEPDAALRSKLVLSIARSVAEIPFTSAVDLVAVLETKKAWPDADSLLAALIDRTALGTAPEAEANRQSELKLRRAHVLKQLDRPEEAEKLITEQITQGGDEAPFDLFRRRAILRAAQDKATEAVADYDIALKRGAATIKPSDRKAMLIATAQLEYTLKRYDQAHERAREALKLPGPPGRAQWIRLRSALHLKDKVVSAVSDYEKLQAGADKSAEQEVGGIAKPHIKVRDLIRQLDGAGDPSIKARAALKAEADKDRVALWLVRDLVALSAAPENHPALRARLALLHDLHPGAPKPPPAQATPADLTTAATAAADWWAKR